MSGRWTEEYRAMKHAAYQRTEEIRVARETRMHLIVAMLCAGFFVATILLATAAHFHVGTVC